MKKLILTLFGLFISSILFSQTSINIRAFIDGKDQIIIKDSTVQWLHLTCSAPGRLSHQNLPTYINGKEWFPVWPDIPDDENRQECYSSVYTELSTPLPKIKHDYSLNTLEARRDVFIAQQPTDTNNFTLVIEFDDSLPFGADWYEVSIDSILTEIESIANSELTNVQIYPNPTSGIIKISMKGFVDGSYNIEVLNNLGIAIKTKTFYLNEAHAQVDISKYPSGLYFIRMFLDNEKHWFKIIKK